MVEVERDDKLKFNILDTKVNITTSIPIGLRQIAIDNNIPLNEALIFGLKFIMAERSQGEMDYPPNTLSNKLEKMGTLLNQISLEKSELEDKFMGKPLDNLPIEPQYNVDEVFEYERI